jgi:hypothetical protein
MKAKTATVAHQASQYIEWLAREHPGEYKRRWTRSHDAAI